MRILAEDHDVVFVTGRPEYCRGDTRAWLERNGLGGYRLVMRPAGDRRPAATVKVELVRRLARRRTVGVVWDDDRFVLEGMRRAGLRTKQAAWEVRTSSGEASLMEAQQVEGRT